MGFTSDTNGLNDSSDVDHQQTTNRTHDEDNITPESVTTDHTTINNTGARAHLASDTTIPANSFTRIPLDTIDYTDPNVTVDTTNNKIDINTAGRYLIIVSARYSTDGSSTGTVQITLNTNTIEVAKDQPEPDNNQALTKAIDVRDLSVNDSITGDVRDTTGSNQILKGDSSYTHISVTRLA